MELSDYSITVIRVLLVLTFVVFRDIIVKMSKNYPDNTNAVPSFAKAEAYDFEETRESLEIYRELNAIAEEIERCRLRNC